MAGLGSQGDSFYNELTGRTARLMLYGLLAITLMALDHRGGWLDSLRQSVTSLVEPVYHLVDLPYAAGGWVRDYFGSRQQLSRRLADLEWQRLASEARLNQLADLKTENAELRAMLEARQRTEARYTPAELMRVELHPHSHRILVNRGRQQGVEAGQAVVDAGGVLGQVSAIYRNAAEVTLISDPNHALPVTISRTGVRTIAYGTGDTRYISLPDLPANADLEVGDRILTSGLDQRFPAGLPVGEIVSIQTDAGRAFAEARAHPAGHLDRSRHVLLLQPVVPVIPEPVEDDDEVLFPGPEPQPPGETLNDDAEPREPDE